MFKLMKEQLKNANDTLEAQNKKLEIQNKQLEIGRKSRMERNKSNLILLLKNLSSNMENAKLLKLGGDFKEILFTDQTEIERQIFPLIAEMKARTISSEFVNLLKSVGDTVLSYWDIQSDSKTHAQKAEEFQKYKLNLEETINKLNNLQYEY
jgi:hypothetical protein